MDENLKIYVYHVLLNCSSKGKFITRFIIMLDLNMLLLN